MASLYPRYGSRRSLIPPPDYSGVLFNNASTPADNSNPNRPDKNEQQNSEPAAVAERQANLPAESAAQPENQAQRRGAESDENVTLPLPAPDIRGLDECLPRYPLPRRPFSHYYNRQRKRYTLTETAPETEAQPPAKPSPITDLLSHAGFDDMLLAALILMMLESGNADPITVLLLGLLLI